MSLLSTVLRYSDQELIPDVRPEDLPDADPFSEEEEDADRQSDEEVWDDEEDEE